MTALEPLDEWRSNPQWLKASGRMLARLRQRKAGEYADMRALVDANAAHPTPQFFNSAFAEAFRIFDQEQAMTALEPLDEWRRSDAWLAYRNAILFGLRAEAAHSPAYEGAYALWHGAVKTSADLPVALFYSSAMADAFRIFDQEQAAQRDALSGDSETPVGGDGFG